MKARLFIGAVLLGSAALASAQTSVPPRPATLADVVAEVRALRADIQQMQGAGVRAQLLIARLQVQEQRIAGIARELAQTEEQIRGLEAARNPFTDRMLQELSKESSKPEEAEFQAMLKGQLERIQNGDPALNERVASLSRLLAEEQARWAAFNAQLEALERELPVLLKKQ
jgi:chromosome segregation ATPase